MICTFFGHRNTPQSVKPLLREALTELIEEYGVKMFYVGNHGSFDRMALSVMKELAKVYPQIGYRVVLAYYPTEECENTVFPEGIECVPKRFAINFRNKWMTDRSDIVVAYVKNPAGNSAKFVEAAKQKDKKIINLFEILL